MQQNYSEDQGSLLQYLINSIAWGSIQVVLPSLKQFLGNIVDLRQDPQYIWIRLVVLLLKVPNLGSCLQWCETNL